MSLLPEHNADVLLYQLLQMYRIRPRNIQHQANMEQFRNDRDRVNEARERGTITQSQYISLLNLMNSYISHYSRVISVPNEQEINAIEGRLRHFRRTVTGYRNRDEGDVDRGVPRQESDTFHMRPITYMQYGRTSNLQRMPSITPSVDSVISEQQELTSNIINPPAREQPIDDTTDQQVPSSYLRDDYVPSQPPKRPYKKIGKTSYYMPSSSSYSDLAKPFKEKRKRYDDNDDQPGSSSYV